VLQTRTSFLSRGTSARRSRKLALGDVAPAVGIFFHQRAALERFAAVEDDGAAAIVRCPQAGEFVHGDALVPAGQDVVGGVAQVFKMSMAAAKGGE